MVTGDEPAVLLSLVGVRDKAAFMERCARVFRLPDWFGRNWDALADCLTDLSWAPDVRDGLVVVSGWQEYARTAPGEWETARQVLADAAAHWRGTADGGLRLVFAGTPCDES